jgi:hypothetical protein
LVCENWFLPCRGPPAITAEKSNAEPIDLFFVWVKGCGELEHPPLRLYSLKGPTKRLKATADLLWLFFSSLLLFRPLHNPTQLRPSDFPPGLRSWSCWSSRSICPTSSHFDSRPLACRLSAIDLDSLTRPIKSLSSRAVYQFYDILHDFQLRATISECRCAGSLLQPQSWVSLPPSICPLSLNRSCHR